MSDDEIGDIRRVIDGLLRQRRPDRFVVSGDPDVNDDLDADEVADNTWLDRIADDVVHLIDGSEARKTAARDLVGRREGRACQRANKLFRDYHRQPTLHGPGDREWMGDAVDDPVVVTSRLNEPGQRVKVLHEHVALRAITSDDLRRFATEERRRAAADFSARNDACAGAESIADEMDDAGCISFGDWLKPPPDDDSDGDDVQ